MKALKPGPEYWNLIRRFPLVPLRSESDLDRATAIMDELTTKKRSRDEDAYLDVLSDLAEKYEAAHHPIPDVSGAAMLEHLIEAKGVTQRQTADATGIPESTISDLLAERRQFTRRHIQLLARYFHTSPAVFLGEEETRQ